MKDLMTFKEVSFLKIPLKIIKFKKKTCPFVSYVYIGVGLFPSLVFPQTLLVTTKVIDLTISSLMKKVLKSKEEKVTDRVIHV